ncbi:phospholipid carrier-dependent glycosyltransferase [Geomonas silvestris]|uniref:phospholipid carrier-dependent glycosyltransferase n=1 Tax=Geomonas silvestris TaxID=2740184 RepID=UPI00161FF1CD|nr:phospholipid carrier-dependent glycosyltransferase [Geomonas silvestris]
MTGTGGWQSVEFYGQTGKNQSTLEVTVGLGGYGSMNSGTAWFKDVEVQKMDLAPPGVAVAALRPESVGAAPVGGTGRSAGGLDLVACAAFGLVLLLLGGYLRSKGPGRCKEAPTACTVAPSGAGLDRVDAGILLALSAVCLAVSLFHLGGHHAPESGWQSAVAGNSVTIELGREAELSRIYYFSGIDSGAPDLGRFTVSARGPGGDFVDLASFAKDQVGAWKYLEVAVRTSAVRLRADVPGGRLNEIALVEKGSTAPLPGLRIGSSNLSAADRGKPENLIDEQDCFEYAPSFWTGFYFDEIYHARSAWEMLNGVEPYETTHPPLGKLLIASGIALFGMNPFGWRIAGVLFGVALVPLVYLFGLKLFRDRFYAFCAAFLMLADFMRFTQTRVAVIDVFGVFFILVLYYFVLDLFPREGELPPRSTNATLFLAGTAFGIGAACKWIVLYAGGGMLLLVILKTLAELVSGAFPGVWLRFVLRRVGVCLVAFGAIPAAIYLLAYLPFLALPGPGHGLADVVRLQEHMLNYHRTLKAVHPFSSAWWTWPLDLRPVWMFTGPGNAAGTVSTIACFGNPAIFWLSLPAVAGAGILAFRRRDARLGIVLVALLFQYLPWVGINRLAFIYHFFSSVPFVIMCLVATLKAVELPGRGARLVACGYLALATGFFLCFFPVLSGLPVQEQYLAQLRWLPSWLF